MGLRKDGELDTLRESTRRFLRTFFLKFYQLFNSTPNLYSEIKLPRL